MTNRIDIFYRTFNRRPGAGQVREYFIPAPADTSLANLLEAAHQAGVPLGGAGRQYGGIFELQTDAGIWSTQDGGKLTPRHGTFRTWEEIEQEEVTGQQTFWF